MEWTLGFIGIILLTVGLIGQAFQMRNIRLANYRDDELASPNVFMNSPPQFEGLEIGEICGEYLHSIAKLLGQCLLKSRNVGNSV